MAGPHDLNRLIGYHLRRASSVMMADLAERLAELGLRTTEASILAVLESEPGITQSEIGRRLSIKRANMAPLIAGLVARDLIVRGDPVGRANPLTLSRKGGELAMGARQRMDQHDFDFFGQLSPEHQRQLQTILADLWRDRVDTKPFPSTFRPAASLQS